MTRSMWALLALVAVVPSAAARLGSTLAPSPVQSELAGREKSVKLDFHQRERNIPGIGVHLLRENIGDPLRQLALLFRGPAFGQRDLNVRHA